MSGEEAATTARRIVTGVDGSESSADALGMADLLAGPLGARVLAVHSHPYGRLSSVLGEGEYERLVREVAESTFSQVKAQLRKEWERELRLVSASSPAAGLSKIAEQERASLIVVGPSHRSGFGRVRPGSVGQRLLNGATAPVGVAPRGFAQSARSLETVGCAFDGSPESRLAVEWAAQVSETSDSQLALISVHTPMVFGHVSAGAFPTESVNQALRRELKQEQRDLAASLPPRVETTFLEGDAASSLEDASEGLDILVMGSRGYGPLRATLLGSVSQKVVRNAGCPVIVCPRSLQSVAPESDAGVAASATGGAPQSVDS